jgi:hypothetical protein
VITTQLRTGGDSDQLGERGVLEGVAALGEWEECVALHSVREQPLLQVVRVWLVRGVEVRTEAAGEKKLGLRVVAVQTQGGLAALHRDGMQVAVFVVGGAEDDEETGGHGVPQIAAEVAATWRSQVYVRPGRTRKSMAVTPGCDWYHRWWPVTVRHQKESVKTCR